MFQDDSGLSTEELERLRQLKSLIEQGTPGTPEYNRILKEYYEELDDFFPFLEDPLPPNCELEAALLPSGYLEFKERCLLRPYTLLKHCQYVDAIALVQVVAVRRKGARVIVKVLELFKGEMKSFQRTLCGYIQFEVYRAWYCANFYQGEKALALLKKCSDNTLTVWSSKDRIPVFVKDETEIAVSNKTNSSYWNNINLPRTKTSGGVVIPWSDLRLWLRNNV